MAEDPVVAAAKGHQIDLDSVQSLADFAQACNWLRAGRSYAALRRAAKPRLLPPATLSDLLNAKSTPTRDTVISFLIACGLDQDAAQRPWLAAWERVATTNQPRPAGAVRVRLARPRLLGVHAAIQVPGVTEDMPAYVPRDFDADLNATLTATAAQGGFILLLGGSSVGKTRALYEAIRAQLAEWWLLHPADPLAINALAEAPTPRTVLWLDEMQRYLNHPTGLSVGTLRQLITAGTVVVATLWPHEYTMRTVRPPAGQPDPYDNDRELLKLAQLIKVSETFSLAERRRGETFAGTDQRIRIALDSPEAGFTQVLAAGPALIRRWEHADPYARAVLTAAVDATRLGMRHPLPPELLMAMAPAYCTGRERAVAPAKWFEMALAYVTELLQGAAAALAPAGGATMGEVAGFDVADYLLQHASAQRRVQPVPAGAWEALLAHAHHRDDVERLAASAKDRLRLCYAVPLYRRVLEAGDSQEVNDRLAELAARQGRTEDIQEATHRQPGNYPPIPEVLATLLANPGRVEELRVAAHSGDWHAADRLAELLATRQRKELGDRAASGDLKAARLLTEHDLHNDIWIQHGYNCGCLRWRTYWRAWLLAEDGYVDDAITIARGHRHYNDDPIALWAWLLAEHGRVDTLVAHAKNERQAARLLLDHDHIEALRIRAEDSYDPAYNQIRNANRHGKWRRALDDDGSSLGAWRLAELLADPGRVEDALAVLRTYADLPLPWVWTIWADRRLIEVLFDHGRVDELRFRAARSNAAARRLADLLAQRGRVEEALTMLRGLADQNHAQATWLLVRMLVERGRTQEALAILRPLVKLHESDSVSADERWEWPTRRLAQLLAAEGHIGELRDLIEGFRASFHYASDRRLAELLAEHGHPGELRAEIDAGNPFAAERVIDKLASQGKFHEADRMWRFGLTAEGLIAERPS
ncbi:hypothetical protein GCM10010103_64890 [Streptomyces paradoxus]|uniref:Tetratricopeptide repeat protein n=1 Tax=Streptomyces paradoxus TaxID=66375 RepID=A0A7W9TIR4_9ACTN|nr:hypothetical protein [Streptomyces paradoxus]MBB6081101.1 hypothetical protein [Streptomyces paradoxus]